MWEIATFGIVLSPILWAFGSVFIEGAIRPLLISKTEIDRLAQDLISRFEDPVGAAMLEEHFAWYRSDNFHQGKWRRVRRRIQRINSRRASGSLKP